MKIVLLLAFLCLPLAVFSQDPEFVYISEIQETEAKELTRAYDKELGLTSLQETLFQEKVMEILMRTEQLTSTRTGEPQPYKLDALKKEEADAMRKILTKRQYTLYIQLRDQLQPPVEVHAIVEQ
jgi:hypothetical protein